MTRFVIAIIVLTLWVGFMGCRDTIVTGPGTTDSSGSGEDPTDEIRELQGKIDELEQRIEEMKTTQVSGEQAEVEETPPMEGGNLIPPSQQTLPTTEEMPPEKVSVEIDTVPPRVIETWPESTTLHGRTAPWTISAVTVTFSEPVDSLTLQGCLTMKGVWGAGNGQPIPISEVTLLGLNQLTAQFTLGASLVPGTTYQIWLAGVRDAAGNLLDGNHPTKGTFTWLFETMK